MTARAQVLFVEDEADVLKDGLLLLRSETYVLVGARSTEEACAALEGQAFDVVVTDLALFDQPDGGMQVIRRAKELDATIGAIMVTGIGGQEDAVQAIQELGANGFLLKPLDYAECRTRIEQAIEQRRQRLIEIQAIPQRRFVPGFAHRNVYVILGSRDAPGGLEVCAALDRALQYYGFTPVRAAAGGPAYDRWSSVQRYLDGCNTGVVLLTGEGADANAGLELGYLVGQNKRCLILAESGAAIPGDPSGRALGRTLAGQPVGLFSSDDLENTVRAQIARWMGELGIVPGQDEKLVLLVSAASSDLAAMAQVLLREALVDGQREAQIRVESASRHRLRQAQASAPAREAIEELCGRDLLATYQAQPLSSMLVDRADLILVMAERLKQGLPEDKTFCFRAFFGLAGEAGHPATDGEDTWVGYRRAAAEIKGVLESESNLGRLIQYVTGAGESARGRGVDPRRAFEVLSTRLSEDDLRTFCLHLEVDYENLPAVGKANKARELILYLRNRDRLLDLVTTGQELRPDIPWSDVLEGDLSGSY